MAGSSEAPRLRESRKKDPRPQPNTCIDKYVRFLFRLQYQGENDGHLLRLCHSKQDLSASGGDLAEELLHLIDASVLVRVYDIASRQMVQESYEVADFLILAL